MKKKFYKKEAIFVALVLLVATNFVMQASADIVQDDEISKPLGFGQTYYVAYNADPGGSGGPEDPFQTIKQATDIVQNGDEIKVYNGLYIEPVIIDAEIKVFGATGTAYSGAPDTEAIIDGNRTGSVISVLADNVRIEGFVIRNSNIKFKKFAGIYINYDTAGIFIVDCEIYDCYIGIMSQFYTGEIDAKISINNNIIHDCELFGIWLQYSDESSIDGNTVYNNTHTGIFLFDCQACVVSHNLAELNDKYGVAIDACFDTRVFENSIVENTEIGIIVSDSMKVTVTENNICDNGINAYWVDCRIGPWSVVFIRNYWCSSLPRLTLKVLIFGQYTIGDTDIPFVKYAFLPSPTPIPGAPPI